MYPNTNLGTPGLGPPDLAKFQADSRSTTNSGFNYLGGYRYNLIPNPNFETNTGNWQGAGIGTLTVTQDSNYSYAGKYSLRLVQTTGNVDSYALLRFNNLPPGVYTFSAYAYISSYTSGASNNRLMLVAAGSQSIPVNIVELDNAAPIVGQWVRYSITTTVTASNFLQVRLYAPQGTINWDNVMLEPSATLGDYFDGLNQAQNYHSQWLGTPNLSSSYAILTPGANTGSTAIPLSTNVFPGLSPNLFQFAGVDRRSTETTGLSQLGRTNMLVNPGFVGSTGWGLGINGGNGVISYSQTNPANLTSYSAKVTFSTATAFLHQNVNILNSHTYTVSVWVYIATNSGNGTPRITIDGSTTTSFIGGPLVASGTPSIGSWQKITNTFTIPTGGIYSTNTATGGVMLTNVVQVIFDFTSSANTVLYWANPMMEDVTFLSSPNTYFDGSYPLQNYLTSWLGAPYVSQSFALYAPGVNAGNTELTQFNSVFPSFTPEIEQFVSDPRSPINSVNLPVPIAGSITTYGLQFDGSQNYVSLGTMGNFGQNLAQGFYASFNINTTYTGGQGNIFGTVNVNTTVVLGVYLTATTLVIRYRDNVGNELQASCLSASIANGNNNLVTITANLSTNTVIFTVNGKTLNTSYVFQQTPSSFINFAYPMVIGAWNLRGVISSFLSGTITNFQIGTSPTNLYGSYAMQENGGTTIYDNSGYQNNGTLTGTPVPAWALMQSLLTAPTYVNFDPPGINPMGTWGTNFLPDGRSTQTTGLPPPQYAITSLGSGSISIALNNSVIQQSPRSALTVIVWFYNNATSGNLGNLINVPNGYGYATEVNGWLITPAVGRQYYSLNHGNPVIQGNSNGYGAVYQQTLQNAFTWDGQTIIGYLNGLNQNNVGEVNSSNSVKGFLLTQLPNIWTIPSMPAGYSLKDLQIYNVPLTAQQIAFLYQNPSQLVSGTPPILWFQMNEGQGKTIIDSMNGIQATLTNFSWSPSIINSPAYPMAQGNVPTTVFPGSPLSDISQIPDIRSTQTNFIGIINYLSLYAILTPIGVIANSTQKTLTAIITPVGTIAKQTLKSLIASITPSGLFTSRQTNKTLTANITPTGTTSKQTNKSMTGNITPSGSIAKSTHKSVSGSLTPSGQLAKKINKYLSASITPSGSLNTQLHRIAVTIGRTANFLRQNPSDITTITQRPSDITQTNQDNEQTYLD